jgi:3-methyladenine DNA glycosylase AlkD
MTATNILKQLKALGSPERAVLSLRFFKTGKGKYGEGDRFLGVTVPEVRVVAKANRDLPFAEIEKLLASPYHEARLTGLLALTYRFERAGEETRKEIFMFVIAHRFAMNNWDLVDQAAPRIIGAYLSERKSERKILYRFAKSKDLWERRIAVVSTLAFIRRGDFSDTLAIAEMLLTDKHDLIHKATGWMLREVGKRDELVLKGFLDAHAAVMPRTMLRYAIERFAPPERAQFLGKGRNRV